MPAAHVPFDLLLMETLDALGRYQLPVVVLVFNNGGIYGGDRRTASLKAAAAQGAASNGFKHDPIPTDFVNDARCAAPPNRCTMPESVCLKRDTSTMQSRLCHVSLSIVCKPSFRLKQRMQDVYDGSIHLCLKALWQV